MYKVDKGSNGRVLLVCQKNKWHDLWRKLVTCLFFEEDKKTFLLIE